MNFYMLRFGLLSSITAYYHCRNLQVIEKPSASLIFNYTTN